MKTKIKLKDHKLVVNENAVGLAKDKISVAIENTENANEVIVKYTKGHNVTAVTLPSYVIDQLAVLNFYRKDLQAKAGLVETTDFGLPSEFIFPDLVEQPKEDQSKETETSEEA